MNIRIHKHFMVQHHFANNQKGATLLLTVIILGAVASVVSVTMLVTGTDFLKTSGFNTAARQAKYHAESCAEIALMQIRQQSSFVGSGSRMFDKGSCTYSVADSGSSKIITATGINQNVTKRIRAQVTSYIPTLTVSSWQDVASF